MAKEPTGAREELVTDRASCRVAATRQNMLKYFHAKFNHIRNLLARALRGAYCRAFGGYVVEDSRREGKGAYCWFLSWAGPLHALLTVANVVSVANSNFQLATLVLIIGNILTLATFSKIV